MFTSSHEIVVVHRNHFYWYMILQHICVNGWIKSIQEIKFVNECDDHKDCFVKLEGDKQGNFLGAKIKNFSIYIETKLIQGPES
jgi:hypothetical protein